MIDADEFARLNRLLTGQHYSTHFTGLLYEVLGLCKDWPAEQVKVVHRGLTGRDKGNLHSCSLAHFSVNFKLVEPAILAEATIPRVGVEPVPEWVADNSDKGSGV